MGAVTARADALAYLEALHGERPEPSVIVVTPTTRAGGFGRSHFVRSPKDALDYVLGVVDVYVRITPIAHRLRTGRGTAEDAITLPTVWAELDVNGTPGRNGELKAGAFPNVEAALDVAHVAREPSMVIGSAEECTRTGCSIIRLSSAPPRTGSELGGSSRVSSAGYARRRAHSSAPASTRRSTSHGCSARRVR